MSKKIARARKIMRKMFEKDLDFKRVYLDNIAMYLFDNIEDDMLNKNRRDNLAKGLLKLIFYQDS